MIKEKIYISGKISGLPLKKVTEKFKWFSVFLREKGFDVVNPIEIQPISDDKTWLDYMAEDIKALMQCDSIYMIYDWGQSKGARIEYAIARELGLKIYFHDEFNL